MDDDDVKAITSYLMWGVYPPGMLGNDKRSLRKKAASFVCHPDGRLYHCVKGGKHQAVITEEAEKQRLLLAAHTEPGTRRSGLHNGINVTINKISDKYWWRHVVEDVKSFCRNCETCASGVSRLPVLGYLKETWQERNNYMDSSKDTAPVAPAAAIPTELVSDIFPQDVLMMLHRLREEGILCDIVLSAGMVRMQAHKLVLVAGSTYLKSLLLDPALPVNDFISFENITGAGLKEMVSFLYSGRMMISCDNSAEMMTAAATLGIQSAVELIQRFIEKLNQETTSVNTLHLDEDNVDVIHEKPDAFHSHDSSSLVSASIDVKRNIGDRWMNGKFPLPKVRGSSRRTKKFDLKKTNLCSSKNTTKTKDIAANNSKVPVSKARGDRLVKSKKLHARSDQAAVTMTRCLTVRASQCTKKVKKCFKRVTSKRSIYKKILKQKKNYVVTKHGQKDHYSCSTCGAKFNMRTLVLIHCRKRHGYDASSKLMAHLLLRRSRNLIIQNMLTSRQDTQAHVGLCIVQPKPEFVKLERTSQKSSDSCTSNTWSCHSCRLTFDLRCRLLAHNIKAHDQIETISPHPSATCGRLFGKFSSRRSSLFRCAVTFSSHAIMASKIRNNCISAKGNKIDSNVSITSKCGWCGLTFPERRLLVEHRRIVHCKRQPHIRVDSDDPLRRHRPRDWNCHEKSCTSLKITTKENLAQHMSDVHPLIVFSCPRCPFKTQIEHFLKRERYVCQQCGKAYHKPFLLRVHMFTRHRQPDPLLKLYHCEVVGCDYSSPSKTGITVHLLKHSQGKTFVCAICGKAFKRETGLNKHSVKVHHDIRPYICDKCGMSYSDEQELKLHLSRHAEDKPYPCSHCSYSSIRKGSLKSHLFSRHGVLFDNDMTVLQCDQCPFSTNTRCRYEDHLKIHRNIRDIPCSECSKLFITKQTLYQHMLRNHRPSRRTGSDAHRCSDCEFTATHADSLLEHRYLVHSLVQPDISNAMS